MPPNVQTRPDAGEEQRRAANGYLLWPLALANLVREDEDVSAWSRIHTRQAFVMGIIGSLLFLTIMALPLVVVIADGGITTSTTIGVYSAGIVVDLIAAVALIAAGVRCAARAARGELFAIPLITFVADRCFRRDR